MNDKRVDLPAPLGPISAVMPPCGMSRLTLSNMVCPPMPWLTFWMEIIVLFSCFHLIGMWFSDGLTK